MQSKYSLTGKKLKQSFVHHNTRPGTAFFPWLKKRSSIEQGAGCNLLMQEASSSLTRKY